MPTPPKAYVIGEFAISDPEGYMAYVRAVEPLIAAHGGRYLVRAGESVVLEGSPVEGRLLVFEFPSLAAARAFYDAPDYREIMHLRTSSATSRLIIAEGYAG